MNDLTHPDILRAEGTGYGAPESYSPIPHCPVCGEILYWDDRLTLDRSGDVLGCNTCTRRETVADYLEEHPGALEAAG